VDEAQGEVRGGIESVTELRGEVDRQKVVMADLESQRQTIVTRQAALSEVELNTQQLQRHGSRAEEKLQHLRKQVHMSGSESQQAIDDLHKQLIEAEAFRLQVGALGAA
jgi:predicted  nucleic acid-binding Zn-ribbon protein